MDSLTAHALAALVVALVAVAVAGVWYYRYGWQTFSFASGPATAPAWAPNASATVDRLRFKKATFTITTSGGVAHTADVTAVLNGMAVAYRGAPSVPATLVLARPLNPYSFAVAGVNDPTVTSGATSDPLAGATATLTGYYKTI